MPEPETPQQRAAWWKRKGNAALGLILWLAWDPIGAGVPPDEYDNYVGRVAGLLERGPSADEVAALLASIRHDYMRADGRVNGADREAAYRVCEWYLWETNQRERFSDVRS